MVTLIQLEYIVAVDTYRHFAQAASHCFVTQPTLSMQIKKMEEDLDVVIFDRTRQPVVPTDIGVEIIAQARRTLAESRRIDEMVKKHKHEISGELRIGIIPTLGPYLLPLFAGSFKKQFPQVHLFIEESITEHIAEKLKKEQLDAGIFVTPYEDKALIEVPLFYEEMMVYAHKDHPILQQSSVSITDMATPDIWLLGDGHCFRNQVINLCSLRPGSRQELPFDLEGGSLETLMRIIRREGGYTIVPELAMLDLAEPETKRFRPFTGSKPLREVSICYSKNYVKSQLLKLLAETIKNTIPEHMIDASRGDMVRWK